MVYTDAEAGLTGTKSQEWFGKKKVAHNITLKYAPVAERMIGYMMNQIINAMRGTDNKWWEVVDDVVKDYNEKHASRSTLITPKQAAKSENQSTSKQATIEHQKDGRPAPTTRTKRQGQGHHQEEVRARLHAGVERQSLYR